MSRSTDANLDCVFFGEAHFFKLISDFKIKQDRIELGARPVWSQTSGTSSPNTNNRSSEVVFYFEVTLTKVAKNKQSKTKFVIPVFVTTIGHNV